MSDYEILVSIQDENIPPKSLKKIQKLKTELSKTFWKAGNVDEKKKSAEYFERDILQSDIKIWFKPFGDIWIDWDNHELDRGNLKLMEKILGIQAEIRVTDGGKIRLIFDLRSIGREKSIYDIFPKFKHKYEISPNWNEWEIEINGFQWKDRPKVYNY